MNAFVAISVICFSIGIVLHLIAGIFKILILGKFKLDQEWLDFKPNFKDLKLKRTSSENRKNIYLRAAYAFLYYLAVIFFTLGLIPMLILVFRR